MLSPHQTPKKKSPHGSSTAQSSPLSKASTPDKTMDKTGICCRELPFLGAESVLSTSPTSLAADIAHQQQLLPTVPDSCPLLAWAHERGCALGLVGADGEAARQARQDGASRRRGHGRFGEYREGDPDASLLLQDLAALHKRGSEQVSATVLTDDAPFDQRPLIRPGGSGHHDGLRIVAGVDESGAWPLGYSEEDPSRWLAAQDVVAVAKRGHAVAELTICVEQEAENGGNEWDPEETAEMAGQEADALVREVSSEGEAQGEAGDTWEDLEVYDEADPELYLLCKDLENLARRGVEDVQVTVLRDDALPDVAPLVWPRGSGHLMHMHDCALSLGGLFPQEQEDSETTDECLRLSLEEHARRLQALGVDLVQVTLTRKAQCV